VAFPARRPVAGLEGGRAGLGFGCGVTQQQRGPPEGGLTLRFGGGQELQGNAVHFLKRFFSLTRMLAVSWG